MSQDRIFHAEVVCWGELGSGNTGFLRMVISARQQVLMARNPYYEKYLLWEFNNVVCNDMQIWDYRQYEAHMVEKNSPMDRLIKQLSEVTGVARTSFKAYDVSGSEYLPY